MKQKTIEYLLFISKSLMYVCHSTRMNIITYPIWLAMLTPKNTAVHTVGQTKWLTLKTITWTDDENNERKWDMVQRTTKKVDSSDAVVIIPLLKSERSGTKTVETILVRQYRPPMGTYTLEFPAGLIDDGETSEQAALRELKEETGYTGEIDTSYERNMMCMSPGLTDETIEMVIVQVDLDKPENMNPKQALDEGESIELLRVSLLDGLKDMMKDKNSQRGVPIALLYTFAVGLEMGKQLSQI